MDIFVRTVALVVFVGILNRWTVHCKPEVINYSPPHPENVTQQTPPPCNSTLVCMQKIPTSYITSHVCGQAALCFWELWNYRIYKAKAYLPNPYFVINKYFYCEEYQTTNAACSLAFPVAKKIEECSRSKRKCETFVAQELYEDCQLLLSAADKLNFTCKNDYQHHHSMIHRLLEHMDPSIEYDNTTAIIGVAHLLPKYFRMSLDRQRKKEFRENNLSEDHINSCIQIDTHVCIKVDYDKYFNCDVDTLSLFDFKCDRVFAELAGVLNQTKVRRRQGIFTYQYYGYNKLWRRVSKKEILLP